MGAILSNGMLNDASNKAILHLPIIWVAIARMYGVRVHFDLGGSWERQAEER